MANLITIRNKKTGGVQDVTPDQFAALKATSRNWEKVGEVGTSTRHLVSTSSIVDPEEKILALGKPKPKKEKQPEAEKPEPETDVSEVE